MAVSICLQVSYGYGFIFLWHLPRDRISRLYSMCVVSLLKSVKHLGRAVVHFLRELMYERLTCSDSFLAFAVANSFYSIHPIKYNIVTHCSFSCLSLMVAISPPPTPPCVNVCMFHSSILEECLFIFFLHF